MSSILFQVLGSFTWLCYLSKIGFVYADVYLHNPRGSNNRLDETTRPRANGNSIFDSQNNERGGYNVGSLFYYQGSTLSIEWTNQHSCGGENNNCEIILQYMCHNSIRDGVTTQTIPLNPAQCANYNCDTDRRYRMHEDSDHYARCRYRLRNERLFTADQNLDKRKNAINTRQNPKGTRRGYECPEERDYYPYWASSPWVDIAVLTNDVSRCSYYMKESQNVKPRGECVLPPEVKEKVKMRLIKVTLPNDEESCKNFVLPKNVPGNIRKPIWKVFPAHGVAAPECRETEFTRDNHLGNGIGGQHVMYNWTVPSHFESENCVLRIRYNISTSDYDPWTTDYTSNANPKQRGQGSNVKMASKMGLPGEPAAKNRGYIFKNNPTVKIFQELNLDLRLAINTAQFGRTFQDRSHTFAIRRRPLELEGEIIHNLNVRGKRGNIVQVYPAVEYDFVPNTLEVGRGDYVHIQWTGSNTNPRNNDGQGLAGTDRNNLVLLGPQRYPEGNGRMDYSGAKFGHYGTNYPMSAENSTFLGVGQGDALALSYLNPGQLGGEMSELDDAGTYFNLPPRKVTREGTYHYMCTRNNNFSNRDQKGCLVVKASIFKEGAIGYMGGALALPHSLSRLVVEKGTFNQLSNVRLERLTVEKGEEAMAKVHRSLNAGDEYASDFYVVQMDVHDPNPDKPPPTLEMEISGDTDDVKVYHAPQDYSVWVAMDADISGGMAHLKAPHSGVYVARREDNIALMVGIIVASVVVVALIIAGTICYFRRRPAKWQAVKSNCRKAQRSTQSQI